MSVGVGVGRSGDGLKSFISEVMALLWDVEVLGIRGHGLTVGCRGPWYQRSWPYRGM